MSEEKIIVSVVIPCFNEGKFIEKCINSLLNQKNMDAFEIIVVDGMSADSTRATLKKISEGTNILKVIDNVRKVTPAALNLGIKNARGEYICIMGAHSEYDENYLANCLSLFKLHPEASCVGGPIISKGKNNFAKAVAIAMSSSVGVGNAKHRFSDYEGYAEMACFPMFKKTVFDEIGYYDENLVRNQDDEFCSRLRLNGGKIYISPVIKSEYFVRDTPLKLFKQYFQYGYYKPLVLLKVKSEIKLRHLIPALFVIYVISLPLAFVFPQLIIPLVLYFLLVIIKTFSSNLNFLSKIYSLFIYPVIHISYGLGFLLRLFNLKGK